MFHQTLSQLIQNLFTNKAPRAARRQQRPTMQVPAECLEQRRLMSATNAIQTGTVSQPAAQSPTFVLDADGTLHVKGTDGNDEVFMHFGYSRDLNNAFVSFRELVVSSGELSVSHRLDGVTKIVAELGGGDDKFVGLFLNLPCVVHGGDGNDTIFGGSKSDLLEGGDGNDRIDASLSGDGIGIANGDQIDGGAGNDTLFGGVGADLILGGDGNDVINFDQYEDRDFGGNDTLIGGNGDDVFSGGHGDDSIDGGAGHDRFKAYVGREIHVNVRIPEAPPSDPYHVVYSGNGVLRDGELIQQITTGAVVREERDSFQNIESVVLSGTHGNDRIDATDFTGGVAIFGGDGNDTLSGGVGNDSLYGEGGFDVLKGGVGGNDTLSYRSESNTFYLDQEGTLFVFGSVEDERVFTESRDGKLELVVASQETSVRHSLEGVRRVVIDLGAGNDQLLSLGNLSVSVDGGAGDDTLQGGKLDDQLSGGNGNDLLSGGEGNDILVGGRGNDSLHGNAGQDQLDGGSGDDAIQGDSGNDSLTGGYGNDTLRGGAGTDLLKESLNPTVEYDPNQNYWSQPIVIDFGRDTLVNVIPPTARLSSTQMTSPNTGTDKLEGIETAEITGTDSGETIDASKFNGAVTLHGGGGNDVLSGGRGNDVLDGGAGNDWIRGRAGNDTLTGGAGNDTLNGGTGVDRVRETGLMNATATSGSLKSEQGKDVLISIQQLDLTGTSGNDKLDARSFAGPVTLSGGDGDDWLIGTSFNDVLDGGNGRDVILSQGGQDTIKTADNDSDVVISARSSLKNDKSQVTKDAQDRVLTQGQLLGNAKALNAVFSGDLNKLWKAIG